MLQPYIESAAAPSDVCMCPCYIRTNILLSGGMGDHNVPIVIIQLI